MFNIYNNTSGCLWQKCPNGQWGKSRQGSVGNRILHSLHCKAFKLLLYCQDFIHILFLLFCWCKTALASTASWQWWSSFVFVFSTEVRFDHTSMCEIWCLWNCSCKQRVCGLVFWIYKYQSKLSLFWWSSTFLNHFRLDNQKSSFSTYAYPPPLPLCCITKRDLIPFGGSTV